MEGVMPGPQLGTTAQTQRCSGEWVPKVPLEKEEGLNFWKLVGILTLEE